MTVNILTILLSIVYITLGNYLQTAVINNRHKNKE